jgi:steroid 5-alpha reductase family enzyme
MDGLLLALIISFAINMIAFVFAYFFKTDKLTDLTYALTFILINLFIFLSLQSTSINRILVLLMIIIWAFRLGIYLFIRINKIKKDNRFDEFRHKFFSFLGFWVLQAATVWIVSLAALFYFRSSSSEIYYLGIIIWLAGIVIETISDYQKFKFISDKRNKNKWIDSGLWHYSRHPNYFGEILCWIGLWITILPSLTIIQRIIAALSPLYISCLILFISGVPILEKKAMEKWGNDHRYEDYVKRTSSLIIWPIKEKMKNNIKKK